jgi:hypothetical protein
MLIKAGRWNYDSIAMAAHIATQDRHYLRVCKLMNLYRHDVISIVCTICNKCTQGYAQKQTFRVLLFQHTTLNIGTESISNLYPVWFIYCHPIMHKPPSNHLNWKQTPHPTSPACVLLAVYRIHQTSAATQEQRQSPCTHSKTWNLRCFEVSVATPYVSPIWYAIQTTFHSIQCAANPDDQHPLLDSNAWRWGVDAILSLLIWWEARCLLLTVTGGGNLLLAGWKELNVLLS